MNDDLARFMHFFAWNLKGSVAKIVAAFPAAGKR
jgi:hypothetical protein